MLSRAPDAPFPLEAARDLLGVVRALYAAAKERGVARVELRQIEAIGRDLTRALELAIESKEGTVGMRAAWVIAERATTTLGPMAKMTDLAEPIVSAARRRVRTS